MTLQDLTLLTRKIVVGIILVIVPFLILWVGIRLSLHLTGDNLPLTNKPINVTQNK